MASFVALAVAGRAKLLTRVVATHLGTLAFAGRTFSEASFSLAFCTDLGRG